MTLTIHYGKSKPAKAVGKNQCNLLDFIYHNPGPRCYKNDKRTRKAIEGLERRGVAIHHKELFMVEFKS